MQVRDALAASGLVPFVKTTGGKGLHVVVPVTPRLDWKEVHAFTGAIARGDRAAAPDDASPPTMGSSEPQAADLHRLPPQCPQRHRGRALFAAGAQQSAGVDAARLGGSRDTSTPRRILNYASLPGLVAASGDPWAEIDDAVARDLPSDRSAVRRRD